MNASPLHGLVAAVHTPFDAAGELDLDAIEAQAGYLSQHGITAAFVAGTTGEGHSLTIDERRRLATRWVQVTHGSELDVIVHAGHNCLRDGRELAAHAQSIDARAVAAVAPSYFKPSSLDSLIGCCAEIAGGAPGLPFYYYDIPSWTGVDIPVAALLEQVRDRVPNFAGVKFTSQDLGAFQAARHAAGGAFETRGGCDEALLAGLSLGAVAAVGSTYNFAAPLGQRVMTAFMAGDLESARANQWRIQQLVQSMAPHGYLGAAKAVMAMHGISVGAPRLPCTRLAAESVKALRADLEQIGFFDWLGENG